jgi:hypothetical protein
MSEEYVQYTVMFTKKQVAMYEKTGKLFGANNVVDVINRGLTLYRIMVSAVEDNAELVMVKKDKASIVSTEDNKKIAILGSPSSVTFVTQEMQDAVKYQKMVEETTGFGMPVDDIGNYALKNN